MSLAWRIYRLAAPGLGALAPLGRVLAPPAERAVWGERMGGATAEGGCDAWIHAASLGEASGVGPFVAALRERAPRARLHLTATTRTGRERLRALGHPATLAPIDSPQATDRFFRGVAPRLLLLVETELWPHWLLRARAGAVPVAVVSARLSRRSVSRYRSLGGEFRSLVHGLAGVLCQTDEDRDRWLSLGSRPERTGRVGNLKHDALPRGEVDRAAARSRGGLDPTRPTLVLGSLRPGEARIVAEAWRTLRERDAWQVVAVPRHADTTAGLREEARAAMGGGSTSAVDDWRWDDRPGVLNGYYAAADIAVVGGTLRPYGGHNPMEPAAQGCAVIVGTHFGSQEDAVRMLREREAIEIVANAATLGRVLGRLMIDLAARDGMAERARAVVEASRGAAARTAGRLEDWGLWPPR